MFLAASPALCRRISLASPPQSAEADGARWPAQNGFGGNPNLLGGLDPAMAGLLGGYDAFSPGPHTPQQLPQQLPVTPSAEELLWHYQAQQLGQGHLATQLPLSGGPSPFAPLPASMPPQQVSLARG